MGRGCNLSRLSSVDSVVIGSMRSCAFYALDFYTMRDHSVADERPDIEDADTRIPPTTCSPTFAAKETPVDAGGKLGVRAHAS